MWGLCLCINIIFFFFKCILFFFFFFFRSMLAKTKTKKNPVVSVEAKGNCSGNRKRTKNKEVNSNDGSPLFFSPVGYRLFWFFSCLLLIYFFVFLVFCLFVRLQGYCEISGGLFSFCFRIVVEIALVLLQSSFVFFGTALTCNFVQGRYFVFFLLFFEFSETNVK